MAALAQLLPEASGDKLPRAVLRNPALLVKSPRAVARSVRDLAESLGLSSWAAARLVAAQPSILASNHDALARRCGQRRLHAVLHACAGVAGAVRVRARQADACPAPCRLERLQQLCGLHRRWQRQLQALSPAALARCLTCSDAAVERLAALADVGAAGSSHLPPIHLLLTKPAPYFDDLLAQLADRQASRRAGAAEQRAAISSSSNSSRAGQPAQEVAGTRQQAAAPAASGGSQGAASKARQLARAMAAGLLGRGGSAGGGSSKRTSLLSTVEEEEEVQQQQDSDGGVQGVLQADKAWRESLAAAFAATASSMAQGLAASVPGAGGSKAGGSSK